MPSNLLTPFPELDDEFCKNFRNLEMTDGAPPCSHKQRVLGFQRRHSLCPVTLPNSKFNSGPSEVPAESCWPLTSLPARWGREQPQLPRSLLNRIPFRVDRSVSMIEGHVGGPGVTDAAPPAPMPSPPPGLSISSGSLPSSTPPTSTRYKTELCRTYEESGACKYGAKCQFAHGMEELRGLSRHPKYKTEPCRTFHTIGFCPYGARCHFIHNADEMPTAGEGSRPLPRERPQLLRQSVSFAGFSSRALTGFHGYQEPLAFSRASSVSPPPSTGSPDPHSPLFPEPGALRHGFCFAGDHGNDQLRFYAAGDSKCGAQKPSTQGLQRGAFALVGLSALQRSTSADSLSDQDGYTSSSSLSGCDSPGLEGRRLPIFSRLSVSDD